jgi:hypothetical protein
MNAEIKSIYPKDLQRYAENTTKSVQPLQSRHIILGVFVGNLLAGIVGFVLFELFIRS